MHYKAKLCSAESNQIVYLNNKSQEIRNLIIETCVNAGTGHFTSSLSCIDLLVALYYGGILIFDPKKPSWDNRDYFILSKGQASPALYSILADLGFYDKIELRKFAQKDGIFGVHLQNTVPGVEITCGSLGMGYGIAAGIALASRIERKENITVALLGDGECYEGSIWETAAFVSHHRLNNLVTIIDRNYICATDFTENLIELEPLDHKWSSFGFHVIRINGHDMEQIYGTLEHARRRCHAKPLAIIADTVKGKGVPSICDRPCWHGIAPTGDFAEKLRNEIKGSAR